MPQPKVAPTSSVMAPAISGARSATRSAAAESSRRRSPGGVAAHAGNAACAASTARARVLAPARRGLRHRARR